MKTKLFLFFYIPFCVCIVLLCGFSYLSIRYAKINNFQEKALFFAKNIQDGVNLESLKETSLNIASIQKISFTPKKQFNLLFKSNLLKTTHLPTTKKIQEAIHTQKSMFSSIQHLENEKLITMIFPIDSTSALLITFFANALDAMLRLYLFIALCAGILLALVALVFLFYSAKEIAKPLKQLNLKAQEIISGGSVEKIQGFEEVMDLDLSLNTCHEMLKEQGKLLKQNAFLQQKEHFDVQLGSFLEKYLFLDPLQNAHSKFIELSAFELFSNTIFGTKALIQESSKKWSLLLFDAPDIGLKPLLELLKTTKTPTFEFHIEKKKHLATLQGTKYKAYLFTKDHFEKIENGTLKKGIFVIFDQGITKLAGTQKQVLNMIEKILKEFEDQGLILCLKMIQKEFELLEQKRVLEKDAKMILGRLK